MLTLYSYYRSSAAYRVRIALNLKRIPYRMEYVNLLKGQHRSDEYLALNPSGLVPSLQTEDGQILTQSTAILEWLEEQYPETNLLPKQVVERAYCRALCQTIACEIHPLNNLRVLNHLRDEYELEEQKRTEWYHHWLALGFKSIESHLSGIVSNAVSETLSNDDYAFGESPSLFEAYLVPQVYNANRFKLDMSPFPKIAALTEQCNQLDAFKQAAPENQEDAI